MTTAVWKNHETATLIESQQRAHREPTIIIHDTMESGVLNLLSKRGNTEHVGDTMESGILIVVSKT